MTKILFTGRGSSGSWQIRGEQLGNTAGKATPKASLAELKSADAVVLVKRPYASFLENIRRAKTPWIWDLVDFYPQPEAGRWSREKAIEWVRTQINLAKPDGIIYPNWQMKVDIGIPGEVVYHHFYPKIKPVPLREEIKRVGYIGAPQYLGIWAKYLMKECSRRGWDFLINCDITELDVVVALRDEHHRGYVQKAWKSNVKSENAHAAGIPLICQEDESYVEMEYGGEIFVKTAKDLSVALDSVSTLNARQVLRDQATRYEALTVNFCANKVSEYVETLLRNR